MEVLKMTHQREEYTAPVCAVLSFQVEEDVTQSYSAGRPEFNVGSDATQDGWE
jgi:hypothetical protein